MINFFITTWMYLLAATAGAVGFYLVTRWKTISISKRLIGTFVIALAFHMLEERVYPAGFSYIFNITMSSNMNKLGVMVCNIIFVALTVFALWKWSNKPWVLLTTAVMGVGEFALHLAIGFNSLSLFESAGQILPYSPGLFSSTFFFLPISFYSVVALVKNKDLSFRNMKSTLKTIGKCTVAMVVISVVVIQAPQIIFNNHDGKYTYTENGYYEQFLLSDTEQTK